MRKLALDLHFPTYTGMPNEHIEEGGDVAAVMGTLVTVHATITKPVKGATLIGNGPEILSPIDAVADDFSMTTGTCGKDGQSVPVGCGQPTLRITSCTVGGTA
jgi:TldD protein